MYLEVNTVAKVQFLHIDKETKCITYSKGTRDKEAHDIKSHHSQTSYWNPDICLSQSVEVPA